MGSTLTYLKSFFNDKDVAAVAPSTRFTVRKVCKKIDFSVSRKIIEYGPGTGVFTRYMLDRMTDDSQLILFETNQNFVEELDKIEDPRIDLYNESVENIDDFFDSTHDQTVDYIVSGIPFSFLDESSKHKILSESRRLLKEKGKFLAYQTSEHLVDPLKETFGNVKTGRVWLNVPPMVVYEARREI